MAGDEIWTVLEPDVSFLPELLDKVTQRGITDSLG
jgi:hypothetical protein